MRSRCSPKNVECMLEVFQILSHKLKIPFGPKMNHDIPPHYAVEILKNIGINSIFLTDSFRVPIPIDPYTGGKPLMQNIEGAPECSLFGEWQKPLTLHYTSLVHHALQIPICSGGGLVEGLDAVEAIMFGATTVQFATIIIKYGFGQITKIIKQISRFMEQNGYTSIEEFRGMAHRHIHWNGEEQFHDARAVVNHDLCVDCGRCTRVVFCQDIHLDELGKVKIEDTCDGCDLCSTVCPVPGALEVHRLGSSNSTVSI